MPRKDTRDSGGGNVTFERFIAAIIGQESGGNYDAVNARTGALGRYQILPSNIPAWSKQYLGQKITAQQFKNSPALQDKLARAVLFDYYNKYGARGAAAAWYSGSAKNADNYKRFNANEPSIGEYVDSVLNRAAGMTPEEAARYGAAAGSRNVSVTTNTTDNTVNNTPVSELGPQKDPNYRPGVTGLDSAGAEAAVAPGSGGMETPGAEGVDRKLVSDQLGTTEQPAAQGSNTSSSTTMHAVSTSPNMTAREQFINYLKQALGTPYAWGGQGPGGFDCSGLIYWAAKSAGLKPPPRLAAQQMGMGKREDWAQLQAGDFVGWDNNPNQAGADHIAVYLGNGQILEAPHSGANVRIRDLTDSDYKSGWGIDASSLYG